MENKNMFTWAGVSLLAFGVSLWIPIIGWVCAPIFLILAGIFAIFGIIQFINNKADNHKYKKYIADTQENVDISESNSYEYKKDIPSKEDNKEWNEINNTNYAYVNLIEKYQEKINNTTDEKKINKLKKKISRLEKHI